MKKEIHMFKNKRVNLVWKFISYLVDLVLAYWFFKWIGAPVVSLPLMVLHILIIYANTYQLLYSDSFDATVKMFGQYWHDVLAFFFIIIEFVLALPVFPIATLLGISNADAYQWYWAMVFVGNATDLLYFLFKTEIRPWVKSKANKYVQK